MQKVMLAVMICAYGQITNTSPDEEFIDPMDMEHYDQSTKSMKFTLKEKKSLELFQGLLQGLLKSADERDLKAVMDIDIGLEINKFLNNEDWDSNKMQILLKNVAFTNPKDYLEKESVELFKGFLQRLLNNADKRGLKDTMDIDIKMEINKFLNNENWDSDKLKIILENVAFPEDKEDWLWTLVVGGVILCVLMLLMPFFYWRRPVQNEVINEAEKPEDNNDYIEDQISTPTPETGQNVQYFRSERRSNADTEQNEKDKCPSQHLQMSPKFAQTQDEDPDESQEQENFISAEVNRADSLMYRNGEHEDTSNAEEYSLFQTLVATGRNDGLEIVRSENQTAPDILQHEEDLYSGFPSQKSPLYKNQSVVQACLPGQLNRSSSSPNVEIKDDASVESDQTLSHTLSSEKKQVVTILGAKESTDNSNYSPELLSCDTEVSSERPVKVDTLLSTHHSQDGSMTVDDESDFIVLSESAPKSLIFINVGACDESL
ncbi:uncharacterized protein [Phyllobates terribilis]